MNRQERIEQDGLTEDPIEFYGGRKGEPWFWASNFSSHSITLPDPFTGEDVYYQTGEHRFQAMKATNSVDHDKIVIVGNPGAAKRIGREIELRDGWDSDHCETLAYYVMVEVVWAKAMQHGEILRSLLKTEDRAIWEDSPYDDIWGIRYRKDYRGRNLLGKAWMAVRDRIYFEQERIPMLLTSKGSSFIPR